MGFIPPPLQVPLAPIYRTADSQERVTSLPSCSQAPPGGSSGVSTSVIVVCAVGGVAALGEHCARRAVQAQVPLDV